MDKIQLFGGISDSLNREPPAIWTYLNQILSFIRKDYPTVECIHFLSEGPSTQYKQKKNFFLFATEVYMDLKELSGIFCVLDTGSEFRMG